MNDEIGPDSRRAAKLLRYLIDGHSVNIDGDVYVFRNKQYVGASDGFGIDISDYTFAELVMLAEVLEGRDLNNVMNYKRDDSGTKKLN